jgi:hypothetical protein
MMLKIKLWLLALAVLMMGAVAYGEDLELHVSEEALQFTYNRDLVLMDAPGNRFSLGVFFDEKRDIIGSVAVMVPGLLRDLMPIPLSFAFGAKALLALLNDPAAEDVVALAPGAGARLDIPIDIGRPMYVEAEVYYAPEILVFGDAENVVDFTSRFNLDIMPRITTFVGYRVLRFDLEDSGHSDYEDNFHVGIRYLF